MSLEARLGGVECGGTSCTVSLALNLPMSVVETRNIPTTSPEETLKKIAQTLFAWRVNSIGIATFGPACIDKDSEHWGFITTTPKPHWANTDVVGLIREYLRQCAAGEMTLDADAAASVATDIPAMSVDTARSIPIGFDTDVNAAALAELHYGEYSSNASLIYVTVGTGIGAGIISKKQLMNNSSHPEAGHMFLRKHPADNDFAGVCPFHGDCLEGLCSNKSIAARANTDVHGVADLPDDYEYNGTNIWDLIAYYLAQMCANLTYVVAPHHIVLGGGVMQRDGLIDKIRLKTKELINGYIQTSTVNDMSTYIVLSRFHAEDGLRTSGIVGSLHVAFDAYAADSH